MKAMLQKELLSFAKQAPEEDWRIEFTDVTKTIPTRLGIQEFYCWSAYYDIPLKVISKGKFTASGIVAKFLQEVWPTHIWWSMLPIHAFEHHPPNGDITTFLEECMTKVDLTGLGSLLKEARLKAFLHEKPTE
jgi:hypothetical protein